MHFLISDKDRFFRLCFASGNILLRAGTVADTIVTDRNGTAISKDIYLGKYKVSEVRPPEGYAISRQVFEANLSKTEPEKAILVRNQNLHLHCFPINGILRLQ